MLYIMLGIAAVGVLFFYFQNEIQLRKKASGPTKDAKKPDDAKKSEPVDKNKTPDQGKLSFQENERPVVIESSGNGQLQPPKIEFEKAPEFKQFEFEERKEGPKNSLLDRMKAERAEKKAREKEAEIKKRYNADNNIEEEEYLSPEERFLRDLGTERSSASLSFAEMFQTLPPVVKVMIVDNIIGKKDV